MGIGDWGLGIWGLGIGPNPQSPIPNPQSPIPKVIFLIYLLLNNYFNKCFNLLYQYCVIKLNKLSFFLIIIF